MLKLLIKDIINNIYNKKFNNNKRKKLTYYVELILNN